MSKQAIIYHNPSCSKSRNSLALLKEHGYEVTEILYLDNPPSKEELTDLCKKMGIKPADIVRKGEDLFKELGFSKRDLKTHNEWLDILIAHPRLIERPIVKIGDKVVMGRPPENILAIMD